MTLLREVTEHPLDPGYEEAARRAEHGHVRAQSAWSQVALVVLALGLGVGLATAALTLRSPTSVRNTARDLLIDQISERREEQDALTARNAELSEEINVLASEQLAAADPTLAATIVDLSVLSGAAAVSGPAYAVTLSDSAAATADPLGHADELVQASDLQVVVNALWAGGAEAVAVNGTRVGPLGAIRGAGAAILVDLVPVTSPYQVVAIGPVRDISASLARSIASTHLAVLRDRYHIGVSTAELEETWMPGARTTHLNFAEPIEEDS